MPHKLAIKRLTASDLTFFEYHYRHRPTAKQKAININADVFVEKLFPGLNDPSAGKRFPVDLLIYGPGIEGAINLQRKILKSEGAKNWRLNGELVYTPDESSRFNALKVGDIAVFGFNEGMFPVSISLVLIAASIDEDRQLHHILDQLLSQSSMSALLPAQLDTVITDADPLPDHPIYELILDTTRLNADLEDVALGGNRGKTKLMRRRTSRAMTRDALLKAKENADFTGLRGEQFVNAHLSKLKSTDSIHDFEWTASINAINPYDFWINYDGTARTLVDVKSTQGEFERTLHISLSELQQMSTGVERYDIFRVFGMSESTAQLRIAENVGDFARHILQVFRNLPEGILADSISFSPTLLPFGPTIHLELLEDAEEE